MTTVVTILQAARDLISKPERWMQWHIALDKEGGAVYADDPTAVRWCAVGALWCVSQGQPQLVSKRAEDVLRGTAEQIFHRELSAYNDDVNRTHEEIMVLYNLAIQLVGEDHGQQRYEVLST